MIFAAEASQVDPTTIGAFVTVILAFLGVAKVMLNQAVKDREADRMERIEDRKEFNKTLTALNVAIDRNSAKSEESIQVSRELSTFMKRLNGTLPRAVEEKQAIKEKEQ